MAESPTTGKKISFQAVDMEVSVAAIEYDYLKFLCAATLRNSDDILREQIRNLQIPGKPTFDEWRTEQAAPATVVADVADNDAETTSSAAPDDVGALNGIGSPMENGASLNGAAAVDPIVEEPQPKRRGRKPAAKSDDAATAPKRRGRKPAAATVEPTAEEPKPKRRGRKPAADTTAKTPGKRGRKPAAAPIADPPELTIAPPAEPAPEPQPELEAPATDAVTAPAQPAPAEETPIKPRRRSTNTRSTNTPPKTPGRRGRPPKSAKATES